MNPPDWAAPFFTPWGWLSLTAITAGLEILMPGAFMIWLAAAALATAGVTALLPLGWGWQPVAFSLFTLVALFGSQRWKRRNPIASADPALNRRTARLTGEPVQVTVAFVGGRGRVRLGDSEWAARGPDLPAGAMARVTGADGAILIVEAVEPAA